MIYLSIPCLIQIVARWGINGIPHKTIVLNRLIVNPLKVYKSHFLNKYNDIMLIKIKVNS